MISKLRAETLTCCSERLLVKHSSRESTGETEESTDDCPARRSTSLRLHPYRWWKHRRGSHRQRTELNSTF